MSQLKSKAKGAWGRAKNVEAKGRGGGGFPPNLKGIVAVCQKTDLKQTQKGDPFFSLTAIVKDPEEFVGRRATFMWFINDSEWATVEDNLNLLSNDLQLLGAEMPDNLDDLPDVMQELCDRGVHFLFNTGGPRKNDRSPNLFIQGLADDWPDEPYETEDSGGDAPDEGEAEGEGGDEGEAESTDESAETEEPWIPTKGEEYNYTAPKTKKAVKVKVTAVDKKKETFDLLVVGSKPPKTYKAVKWHDAEGNPTVEALDE